MKFYEIIDRLSLVFPYKYILKELSEYGVIAGGSIVFALNEFVPLESVGDIDIFVNTKENYDNCIKLLYSLFDIKFKIIAFGDEKNYAVVNMLINNKYNIQIIYNDFITPVDVIDVFDIDYVQCALHKGELYITDRCLRSHRHRQIFEVSDIRFRNNRLQKAVYKGFKSPIVCGYFEKSMYSSSYVESSYIDIMDNNMLEFKNSVYLTLSRDNWYDINTMIAVDIISGYYEQTKIIKAVVFEISTVDGLVTDKANIRSFSYTFDIIESQAYKTFKTNDKIFTMLKQLKYAIPIDNPSKMMIISPYMSIIKSINVEVRSNIIKMLPNVYGNVIPIKIDERFYKIPILSIFDTAINIDFTTNRSEKINYICNYWEQRNDVCKRNMVQCYRYYVNKGKSEKCAVEHATYSYVIDSCKQNYNKNNYGLDYDTYFIRFTGDKLASYGLARSISFKSMYKSDPIIKSFEQLYANFLKNAMYKN